MYKAYKVQPWFDWINRTSSRELLHAPLDTVYHVSNEEVHTLFDEDSLNTTISLIPFIPDSIKVQIYTGQDDLLVNSAGTEAMIGSINWKYTKNLLNSKKSVWKVENDIAGVRPAVQRL
jgi:Serine carboxypeptidase